VRFKLLAVIRDGRAIGVFLAHRRTVSVTVFFTVFAPLPIFSQTMRILLVYFRTSLDQKITTKTIIEFLLAFTQIKWNKGPKVKVETA
jgi:hypothetical protein